MSILELLGGKALKIRILGLLMSNPDQSFGIREIARLCAKGDPGNTHRAINDLEEVGLVICIQGPAKNSKRLCMINREFNHYKELRALCLNGVNSLAIKKEANNE